MERFDRPIGDVEVIPCTIDDAMRKEISDYLDREISRSMRDRKKFNEFCETWEKQYFSRLERPDAGPDDANIDMGLSSKIIRQNASRVINPLFSFTKVITVKSAKRAGEVDVKAYERAIDEIVEKRRAKLRNFAYDYYVCGQVYGMSVCKLGWDVEYEKILQWRTLEVTPIPDEMTGKVVAIDRTKALVEETIETEVGCFPKLVPIKDFFWPWYAESLKKAPWLADRAWYSPREIKAAIREGVFDDILKELGEPESTLPPPPIWAEKTAQASDEGGKYYEVFEVHTNYDVDRDGYEESVIFYWEHTKKKLLRANYSWLAEKRVPYVWWMPESWPGTVNGIGLCFRLEGIHKARNAVLCQRLDAASRANELLLLVRKNSDLLAKMKKNKLRTGIYETTMDLSPQSSDLREIRVSQPFNHLPDLEKQLEEQGLQVGNLSAYNLGFEQSERPTAFGQQALIKEGMFPINMTVDDFREVFAEIVQVMLARYAQFFPEGLPVTLEESSIEEQLVLADVVKWPAGSITKNVKLQCFVSTSMINRELRKQEKLDAMTQLPDVFGFMMKLAESAANPSPISLAAQMLLTAYTSMVNAWLGDLEISEDNPIKVNLEGAVNAGVAMAQMVQQLQQENEQLKGGLGVPSEGAPPAGGGVPAGPPGAPPTSGPPLMG